MRLALVCALAVLNIGVVSAAFEHDTSGDAKWLEANAKKDGVTIMKSGLQYRVVDSAPPGSPHPRGSQWCTVHYTGTLVDGYIFDSSRRCGGPKDWVCPPKEFKPKKLIKGWSEALQLMSPGDRWMLYIPADLGYGESGYGDPQEIPPGATLIFDVELISFDDTKGFFDHPNAVPMAIGGAFVLVLLLYCTQGGGGPQVSASHILVADQALCIKMKELLDALPAADVPAKFEQLAKSKSTCPSASSGGSLGQFSRGQMTPAFDEVCWTAPIGVVQGPVATDFGYHLILVTARSASADGSPASSTSAAADAAAQADGKED